MPQLPRLIKIINVIAKYRLSDVSELRLPFLLRVFLKLYGLPWSFSPVRQWSPGRRLRLALQELGPIYIKFGQLLSTRKDFISTDLALELEGLQDRVPPFSTPSIRSIVETSLKLPVSSIFAELQDEALASASVAQVHSARLLNGDDVVVKVIRPGIERTIASDLRLLKRVAALVEKYAEDGRRLHPKEVIADYEKIILDELNLLSEGANSTQLRRNFEDSRKLYVPRVYWEYSRTNILVMERIYGTPVSDIDALRERQVDLKRLAEIGVEIFFTQVFDHSFFHADMHPGNIFVADPALHTSDSPTPCERLRGAPARPDPQYIAIDCAIIGSLSQEDQQYLARNLLAIFKRDYRKVARLHVECGWVPRHTRIHEFEAAMRTVCEPIFEKPLKDISFGYLLVQLFRTARRFDMEVQPSLVLLQKTLLNVEGLGRQLYPDLDLWSTALPFLENWQRRRLQPSTLLKASYEEAPEWIEQLPQVPELILDALAQSRKLSAINDSLQEVQQRQERMKREKSVKATKLAVAILAVALLSAHPRISEALSEVSLPSLILGLVGVYLLCFKR